MNQSALVVEKNARYPSNLAPTDLFTAENAGQKENPYKKVLM